MKKKGGLGRGLGVFFSEPVVTEPETETSAGDVRQISVLLIDPNPSQPRRTFDEESLRELSESIAAHGVLQPLLAVPAGERYHLVAGERRWRAARLAGLKEVPVRVMDLSAAEQAEISLIENLQRDDLTPLEEAAGIRALMDGFSLTQEEAASRLGKSRSAVANALRLLNLPDTVQALLASGKLSAGHAKSLAGIPDADLVRELAEKAVSQGLSVRQMEELSRQVGRKKPDKPGKKGNDPAFAEMEEALSRLFGTKVSVTGDLEKGRISMQYFSREDLERIYETVMRYAEDRV